MITIWKYELQVTDTQYIRMPDNCMPLSVGAQNDTLCMWVQVNTDHELDRVEIEIFGTGNPMQKLPAFEHRKFIGTVAMPPFIWHVFVRYRDNDIT